MKCPKCHFENPADTIFCGKCGTKIYSPEKISVSQTKTVSTTKKELTTGAIFAGRYEIIEELGKGGMGKVYKALDTEIKEKVALKLLSPEIAADERIIERFRNELKFARKIAHRNVCRMYDLSKEEETYFITMEYVAGEDLKSTIARVGQLSVGKAVYIAKQICEGLSEAHHLGVVHRDLKPQNVMLDKEGNARIMDFGIARSIKARGITGLGVMIGTPEYMSPEQAEVKEVDHRSDIYSFGIILYEMLTGRVPFEGETPLGIAMKHKSEMPKDPKELNSQIPEALNRLILKCLEKNKEKRYQSAGEILSELINLEKGLPTTERIIPKKKPITSKEITVTIGLKKLFIPALIIAAIVAAAVLAWQLLPRKEAVISSIAVISFENQTGDNAYDYLQKAIPNLLITSLEQSKYLRVTTWERMHDLLKQTGKEDVDVIDKDLGFELCRMDSVEKIVLGSFVKAGDMFATDVKVLDVKTKNLIKSSSSNGEGVRSILEKQIGELSREISRGVGISERKIMTTQTRIADVTTSSMEAYNYFLKGRDEYERFFFNQSRQSFEKALALDPNFALAYLYLAKAHQIWGNSKESVEALEKAKALSEKLTEKERLYIEATYAEAVEKDQGKRFRILNEIAEKYPKEKRVYYELSLYYFYRRMPIQIIGEINKALELDPEYGEALNMMAFAYSELGNYEKAIEYLKKYASVQPGDPNPIDSMAELYFRMGNLDEAIAKYKEALRIKPDFIISYIGLSYASALKEDYEEAMKYLDQFIALSPFLGPKWGGYFYKSFLNYWLGNCEQALSELLRLLDLTENRQSKAGIELLLGLIYCDRGELELSKKYLKSSFDFGSQQSPSEIKTMKAFYIFLFGSVDLKEGQVDLAKSKLAEIKSALPEANPAYKQRLAFIFDLFQGEILLTEGSVSKAIAVLEKASPMGKPPSIQEALLSHNIPFLKDVLARAYKEKGKLDKAIAEYEHLIKFDPSREERTLIHPLYYFRLAKLYEEKGAKEKAAEKYERFLSLWKNADPGLSDVIEAKNRLAALKIRN